MKLRKKEGATLRSILTTDSLGKNVVTRWVSFSPSIFPCLSKKDNKTGDRKAFLGTPKRQRLMQRVASDWPDTAQRVGRAISRCLGLFGSAMQPVVAQD